MPEARYLAFVEYAGISARRQGVNGLHVHVGMPDRGDVLPRARGSAALAARRAGALGQLAVPVGRGDRARLQPRAEILAQLPRSGAPPAFRDSREWVAFVDRLRRGSALIPDYTMLWWDVRPHPRFGTLEVRMPDQPTVARRAPRAWSRWCRRSACAAADGRRPPYDPPAAALYQQNRWAALRSGLDAELCTPTATGRAGAGARGGARRACAGRVELGSTRCSRARPRPQEAERQLEIGRARRARGADGRDRRAHARLDRSARADGHAPGHRHPLRALREPPRGRPARRGGPRRREREPHGPGHADWDDERDRPRDARRRPLARGLPRARSSSCCGLRGDPGESRASSAGRRVVRRAVATWRAALGGRADAVEVRSTPAGSSASVVAVALRPVAARTGRSAAPPPARRAVAVHLRRVVDDVLRTASSRPLAPRRLRERERQRVLRLAQHARARRSGSHRCARTTCPMHLSSLTEMTS